MRSTTRYTTVRYNVRRDKVYIAQGRLRAKGLCKGLCKATYYLTRRATNVNAPKDPPSK